MEIVGKAALSASIFFLLLGTAKAQFTQVPACTVDPPRFVSNAPDIFNDRQEQDLGDALAEFFESDMRIAPQTANYELTRVGDRLLATLPPTGIHYRFRIYDSGEINAFSLAGGRVYVSRKLIAAAKNEDELAGVLAHELGHLSTHQTAIEMTRVFRIRLGVEQMGDRADIFAKVHRLFDTPEKAQEEEGRESLDELEADRVALYALVRAGYAAESFPTFFNQVSMNKGKTGNWLSDVFGLTHEDTKRYRAALKLIEGLPAGCKGREPLASGSFAAWHKSTVDERVKTTAAGLNGDQPLKLDSPLRPGLWRVRFSPNGRYILAQDEGGIAVVDRDAQRVLFRIDAPDVEAAQFTPDSASVVFHDTQLRVERWSLATGQRADVKELVVFDGCNQTLLSPDGKALVCLSVRTPTGSFMAALNDNPRVSLRLIDVDSGKPFFDKPDFYQFNSAASAYWQLMLSGFKIANMQVSPDGRYLLVVANDRALAYDLGQRQPVALSGKLKGLTQTRMSFVAADELFVVGKFSDSPKQGYEAQILSFPDGQVLKETLIGRQQIQAVTKGGLLIAWPLKDFAVGILDPMREKFLAESKLPSIDAWEKTIAAENVSGGLDITEIGAQEIMKIPLPMGPLPAPQAAAFSADGKFLAVSLKDRAEIWSLETGKEVRLMRPFRSVWMDKADRLLGQFPKYLDHEAVEIAMDLAGSESKELAKYEDKEWQYHDLQFSFKPLGKDKATDNHATLEAKKMETQTVAWSREYRHETPAIWSGGDGRVVLAWDLSNDTAKDEIKNRPELQLQAEALKNKKKGLLIETVNADTGAPLEQVVIPEADLSGGQNDVRRAMVSGEFVLARGEHGNTAIYRLGNGTKVGEFFGYPVATNAAADLVAAVNREDEILMVDERSGKELSRFALGSPVRAARIVTGKENRLLVLTADQVVHLLPLTKAGAQ